MDHAVRVGLISYGVVHLLIGWIALQLALGDHEESADASERCGSWRSSRWVSS